MTTVKDILNFFETFAPIDTQMSFDNCGLLVGSENDEIRKILVSLDITADVVNEAENLGCELIISHHPVIFQPIRALRPNDVPYLLASKGIDAVCMHTNLDLSESFGVNTCLAKAIGLKNVNKCETGECLFVGELEKEINIQDFALNVKKSLCCNGLRYTNVKDKVKRVCVSSGSGGSNICEVSKAQADVLVTGEIKHNEINEANALGINVVDVGHFKSEDVVILPLVNRLSEKFSEISVTKSTFYSDLINYL